MTSKQTACEVFDFLDNVGRFGTPLTCGMMETTSIDETKVTISSKRNVSVEGLTFSFNRKIFFLPENVNNNFPNLKIYFAENCSIKAISKENFEGLNKLKILRLLFNQIEKISSETFNDLVAIEYLYLGEKSFIRSQFYFKLNIILEHNKIKFMNGEAFDGLNQLKMVHLQYNICIKEYYFITPNMIALMPQVIDEKCGFDESSMDLLADFVCIAVLLLVAISCFFHWNYCRMETRPAPVTNIEIRVIAR